MKARRFCVILLFVFLPVILSVGLSSCATEPPATGTTTQETTTAPGTTTGGIDLSAVSFPSAVFLYDGTAHGIYLSGDLPEGVSVSYSGNGKTDAGTYTVTASFSASVEIPDMTATLTVTQARIDLSAAEWNYTGAFLWDGAEKTVSLDGLPAGLSVAYTENAASDGGVYRATAVFTPDDPVNYAAPEPLSLDWEIEKSEIDISALSFLSETFLYDGEEKSICLAGELPDGVSVVYANNRLTEVGTSEATATLSKPGCEEVVLRAIVRVMLSPLTGVSFPSGQVTYDGQPHSVTLSGELPSEVSVTYTGNARTDAGTYTVTASFTGPLELPDMTATLVIRRAEFNFSKVLWGYSSAIQWDGTEKTVELKGLPAGLSVDYTGNRATDAGTYTARAVFTPDDTDNYITPAPMQKKWTIVKPETFAFSVTGGSATKTAGDYPVGTMIVVTPTTGRDAAFFCWTDGKPFSEGGTIFSYDKPCVFFLSGDTVLFGNYRTGDEPEVDATVLYHLNGGTVAESGDDYLLTTWTSGSFHCYNAIGDTGVFVRPGYTLLEYNTKADGSGTALNPGGKIPVPETGIIELFAVWGKQSDERNFLYTVENGAASVTSYLADEETLIFPNTLGGVPVTTVCAGAVTAKHFVTLSLPRTVETVEEGAFSDCASFDRLYLCDNIVNIYDNSFRNCRRFTRFCYNAGMLPVGNSEYTFALKFELVMIETGNTLVLFSGSSSLNGLNSPLLEELLGNQYKVINYGTNQGSNGVLYMEAASHFLEEGDIVICASEHGGIQYGDVKMAWKTLRASEFCYNIFRYVDMSHYTNLFSAIYELNVTNKRLAKKPLSYDLGVGGLNAWGDTTSNTKHTNFGRPASPSLTITGNTISDKAAAGFNIAFDLLAAKGVTVYFTFPPYLEDCYNTEKSKPAEYVAALQAKLHCTVISDDPAKYTLPYDLMYNSNYHPTAAGAAIRTRLLAEDILAQFERERE